MRIRSLTTLAAVAVVAAALTGCSANSTPSPTASADLCSAAAPSGSASDSVKVAGDAGKPATATFTSPLETSSIERTVVSDGTGAEVKLPKLMRLFRLIKIAKVIRASRIMKRFEDVTKFNPSILRLLKIMFAMVFFWHLTACLYWFIADWEGFGTETLTFNRDGGNKPAQECVAAYFRAKKSNKAFGRVSLFLRDGVKHLNVLRTKSDEDKEAFKDTLEFKSSMCSSSCRVCVRGTTPKCRT